MDKEELLKSKMSFDEMTEVYVANNEVFLPNKTTVGKFAKELGYVRAKQMVNKRMTFFYVKANK